MHALPAPLPLVLALLATGCGVGSGAPHAKLDASDPPPPTAPSAAPTRSLTIAVYNVLYLLGTDQGVDADTLERAATLDADVLLLQETNDAWEAALRPRLAPRYPHCRFHRPTRYAPGGIATCARDPIVEDELLASPVQWFPAQRTVVARPEGRLQILNVHLRPAVAAPPDWMHVHVETRADRAREIADFVSRLDPGVPTIVAGDFNELREGDLFSVLERSGFDSAFARTGSDAITWRWVGAEPPLALQLDHVAYTRDRMTVARVDVLPGGNSDHLALIATFHP